MNKNNLLDIILQKDNEIEELKAELKAMKIRFVYTLLFLLWLSMIFYY